jgi:hypothetical protein
VGKEYLYREVLDHVISLKERHLRRVPQSYPAIITGGERIFHL